MRSVSYTHENNGAKDSVKKGSVFERNGLSMTRLDMHVLLYYLILYHISKKRF